MSTSKGTEVIETEKIIQEEEEEVTLANEGKAEKSNAAVGEIIDDIVEGIAGTSDKSEQNSFPAVGDNGPEENVPTTEKPSAEILVDFSVGKNSPMSETVTSGNLDSNIGIKEVSGYTDACVPIENGKSVIEEPSVTKPEVNFKYPIGQVVNCGAFGEGRVVEQRTVDISSSPSLIYVVQLDDWKLATGKSPHFYTTESYIVDSESNKLQKIIQQAKIKEAEEQAERGRIFIQWMDKALALKKEAGDHFKSGENSLARDKYLEALNVLNDLHQKRADLNLDERAKFYEQTVLCHNNLAVCYLKVDAFVDSISSANSAMMLIAAVDGTKQNSAFWNKMVDNGITEEKLLRDWKKKSLYCLGKAELARKNYTEAVDHLEAALKILGNYTDSSSAANAKDFRGLIAKAKHLKAEETRKEKSTWATAFRKNNTEPEIGHESVPSSPQRDQKEAAPLSYPIPPTSSKKKKDTDQQPRGIGSGNWFSFSSVSMYMGMGFISLLGTATFWYLKSRVKRLR